MHSPRSLLDAWKPLAGRVLQAVLNRTLALDPETGAALAGLEGRRVQLQIDAPPLRLEIMVRERRLEVGPPAADEPDLRVQGGVSALLGRLLAQRAGNANRLRISGDAELAQRLETLARRFDPDIEAPFEQALGPVLGPQLARLLRETLLTAREGAGHLARSGAEYLTEESRLLVARAEQQAHFEAIDVLRDDVERLAARIAALPARSAKPAADGEEA